MFFPTNRFQIWDLILFRHQSRRYVEHLFKCEICCVHNGLTIVQVILHHEYCWFHCYSHEHSPNHRMFFSISWHVGNYFLSFPHLITHPIHEWSWFYWQFQFWFIVSHDEILRSCHFFRISIIRSRWSITKCFSVPYGLRGSVKEFPRDQVELFVPFSKKFYQARPDRSYVVVSVFLSWQDQARSSSNFE